MESLPQPLTARQLVIIIICVVSVLVIAGGLAYAAIHSHAQDVDKRNERQHDVDVLTCQFMGYSDCGD